jgi:hypothetical protein
LTNDQFLSDDGAKNCPKGALCVVLSHHAVVDLSVMRGLISLLHERKLIKEMLRHLQRRVDDVRRPEEKQRRGGRVFLHHFHHLLLEKCVFVATPGV